MFWSLLDPGPCIRIINDGSESNVEMRTLNFVLLNVKSDFILINKPIFTFNDKGLDTQSIDQKINYNHI